MLEVLGRRADGLVMVWNYADVGTTSLAAVDDAIEPDLLFPYVPWASVGRWAAEPDRYLLVPQDPTTRAPYPVDVMRARWPKTLAYLNRFRAELEARSGYRRYFKPDDPFYAIYNVSPETVQPLKVTWRKMGKAMQAAVIGPTSVSDAIGPKPTVFKNTVVYVPVASEEEAFHLTRFSTARGPTTCFGPQTCEVVSRRLQRTSSRALGSRPSAHAAQWRESWRCLAGKLWPMSPSRTRTASALLRFGSMTPLPGSGTSGSGKWPRCAHPSKCWVEHRGRDVPKSAKQRSKRGPETPRRGRGNTRRLRHRG